MHERGWRKRGLRILIAALIIGLVPVMPGIPGISGSAAAADNDTFEVDVSQYNSTYKDDPRYEIVGTKTYYRYATRGKQTVKSGKDSLSGYTKESTQVTKTSYCKWLPGELKPYTSVNDARKLTATVETKTTNMSYAWYCKCKKVCWKNSGGSCGYCGGRTNYGKFRFYSSKSLAASGYKKDSDGSYFLPTTISKSSPGKMGTIYCMKFKDDHIDSFTTGSKVGGKHIYVWSNGTAKLYRYKYVESVNTFSKWGNWSAWGAWSTNRIHMLDGVTSYQQKEETKQVYVLKKKNPQIPVENISYSFDNFSKATSEKVFLTMFGQTERAKLIQYQYVSEGGNCFGMASSAGLLYVPTSGITPSKFNPEKTRISQLDPDDQTLLWKGMTVEEFIQAMFITQFSPQAMTYEFAQDNSLDSIAATVQEEVQKGHPPLVSFYWQMEDEYGDIQDVGHSVLALGLRENDRTTDSLLIYDNNEAQQINEIILTKDSSGHYTKWEYPEEGIGGDGDDETMTVIDYEEYKALWDNRGNLWDDIYGWNLVYLGAYDVDILTEEGKVAASVRNGVLTSTDESIQQVRIADRAKREGILLFMPPEAFTFKKTQNDGKKLQVITAGEDLSAQAETESDEITLCVNDGKNLSTAKVNANAGDNFNIILGSSRENEPETMTWKGTGTGGGDVSVQVKNGKRSSLNTENADYSAGKKNGSRMEESYVITSSAGKNGTITPSGETAAWAGENIQYTIKPNPGFAVKDVRVDGKSVGPVKTYTFNDVQADHTISAIFQTAPSGGSGNTGGTTVKKTGISKAKVTGIGSRTYTGKALTQKVTVKLSGKTLKKGTDYTVSYKNNRKIGTATVTITGKGKYSGSLKRTFRINPKGTSVMKLKPGKKTLTVTWKKQAVQTTGYQIRYSTKRNFKSGVKTVTVKGPKATKKTIKKLASKKTYYVQVRTYKKIGKTTYVSGWSKVRAMKVK